MLTEQRQAAILQMLEKKKSVTVTELRSTLGISESTARRDISALHNAGKLKKVFGGAVEISNRVETFEPTVAQKQTLYTDEKRRIAKYAVSLLEPGDFIYLDAGTTTGYMLDYWKAMPLTVVTNAVAHAQRMVSMGISVILLGGELKHSTEAVIGSFAMQMLQNYHFTKAFIGTNAVSVKDGLTTPDMNEAMIKRTAMTQAKEKYLLADASKFDRISSVTFASFQKPTIITDQMVEGYEEFDNIIVVE